MFFDDYDPMEHFQDALQKSEAGIKDRFYGNLTKLGLPERHWTLSNPQYLGSESESLFCQRCGKKELHYIFHMTHPEVAHVFKVGCICAGWMCGDIPKAKELLKSAKQSRSKLSKFLDNFKALKGWKISAKGNPYKKTDLWLMTVFKHQGGYRVSFIWLYSDSEPFYTKLMDTPEQAVEFAYRLFKLGK